MKVGYTRWYGWRSTAYTLDEDPDDVVCERGYCRAMDKYTDDELDMILVECRDGEYEWVGMPEESSPK